MKAWELLAGAALLVGAVAVGSSFVGAVAGEDAPARTEGAEDEASLKVIDCLKKVKIPLSDACTKAEKSAGGKAIAAELDTAAEKLSYDVVVAVVTGTELTRHHVAIDAVTGTVSDTEDLDAEDDDAEGGETGALDGDDR